MPEKNKDETNKSLELLTKILEEALDSDADAVQFEWESSGDLEIYFMSGNKGAGWIMHDRKVAWDMVCTMTKMAKVRMSMRGKMTITLHGEKRTVEVLAFEHFEDRRYELRFKEVTSRGSRQ